MTMKQGTDEDVIRLKTINAEHEYIWNLDRAKGWGRSPASEKQLNLIRRRCKGFDLDGLTKLQASQILNRVMAPRGAV